MELYYLFVDKSEEFQLMMLRTREEDSTRANVPLSDGTLPRPYLSGFYSVRKLDSHEERNLQTASLMP
jgi:hypothetical protein